MVRFAAVVLLATLASAKNFSDSLIVPNFRDLTIKTRWMPVPHGTPQAITWYFKGARVRREEQVQPREQPAEDTTVTIYQCDLKKMYFFNDKDRTYVMSPLPDPPHDGDEGGGEITVTDNSVDTGERRQVGSYEARHIKATVIIVAGEDTGMKTGNVELDGWYIDPPGWWRCEDEPTGLQGYFLGIESDHEGQPVPHFVFHQHGPRRGLIIEETSKTTPGVTYDGRVEFLGISEQPLDPAWFEVPRDYNREER